MTRSTLTASSAPSLFLSVCLSLSPVPATVALALAKALPISELKQIYLPAIEQY